VVQALMVFAPLGISGGGGRGRSAGRPVCAKESWWMRKGTMSVGVAAVFCVM